MADADAGHDLNLGSYVFEKSLQNIAKLVFLAWILAYFLTKTSNLALVNFPMAVLVVFGLRWLSMQYDDRNNGSDGQRVSKRFKTSSPTLDTFTCFGSAFHSPKAGNPGKVDNSWRDKVRAPLVEHAWETLCGSIIQEFIYDTWYSSLTPDREFPAETRRVLNTAFGEIAARARKLDLRPLIKDVCELVMENIELYRDTRDSIVTGTGLINFMDMTPTARERALKQEMKSENNLHPALAHPDGHYKVMKAISEALAILVLDRQDSQRTLIRTFARELLGACVIRPLMMLCTPYTVNKLLLYTLQERVKQKQSLDAEDMAAKPDVKPELMKGHWEFEQRLRHSAQAEDSALAHKAEKKKQRSMRQRGAVQAQQQSAAAAGAATVATPRATDGGGAGSSPQASSLPTMSVPAAAPAPAAVPAPTTGALKAETAAAAVAEGLVKGSEDTAAIIAVSAAAKAAEAVESAPQVPVKAPPAKPHPLAPDPQDNGSSSDGWEDVSSLAPVSQTPATAAVPPPAVAPPAPPPSAAPPAPSQATSVTPPVPSGMPTVAPQASPSTPTRAASSTISAGPSSLAGRTLTSMASAARVAQARVVKFADDPVTDSDEGPKRSSEAESERGHYSEEVGGFMGRPWAKVVAADLNSEGSKDYVTYKIRVADDMGGNRVKEWTVSRRYRNFETLHRRMRSHPWYRMKLPPKRIFFHNQNVDFVEERRDQLDKYLQSILGDSQLLGSKEVWEFLSKSSEVYELDIDDSFLSKVSSSVNDVKFSMRTKMARMNEVIEDIDAKRKTSFNALSTTISKRFEVGNIDFNLMPQVLRPGLPRPAGKPMLQDGSTMQRSTPDLHGEQRKPSSRQVTGGDGHNTSSPFEQHHPPSSLMRRSISQDDLAAREQSSSSGLFGPTTSDPATIKAVQSLQSEASTPTLQSHLLQPNMSRSHTMPLQGASPPSLRACASTSALATQRQAAELLRPSVSDDTTRPLTAPSSTGSPMATPTRAPRAAPEGVKFAGPSAGPSTDAAISASTSQSSPQDGGHFDVNMFVPPKVSSVEHVDMVQVREKPSLRPVNTAAKEEEGVGPLTIDECTGISAPLYEMVDVVFQLQMRGFFRQKVFNVARQCLSLVAGAAIDEALMKQLKLLRQEHTIARLIHRTQSSLWPGGRWLLSVQAAIQAAMDTPKHVSTPENFLMSTAKPPIDSDEISEAVKELLLEKGPSTLVTLLGKQAYVNGVQDLYEMVQSTTFIQQIGYGLMQVIFANLFPEMKQVFQQFER